MYHAFNEYCQEKNFDYKIIEMLRFNFPRCTDYTQSIDLTKLSLFYFSVLEIIIKQNIAITNLEIKNYSIDDIVTNINKCKKINSLTLTIKILKISINSKELKEEYIRKLHNLYNSIEGKIEIEIDTAFEDLNIKEISDIIRYIKQTKSNFIKLNFTKLNSYELWKINLDNRKKAVRLINQDDINELTNEATILYNQEIQLNQDSRLIFDIIGIIGDCPNITKENLLSLFSVIKKFGKSHTFIRHLIINFDKRQLKDCYDIFLAALEVIIDIKSRNKISSYISYSVDFPNFPFKNKIIYLKYKY